MNASFSKAACRAGLVLALMVSASGAVAGDARFNELAAAAGVEAYPAPLRAPSFRLPTLDGGTAASAEFKGRIVLLSFWASWCPPCKTEFPEIERLKAAFAGTDFEVLGIAVADSPDRIAHFLGSRPAPFPILLDSDRKVAGQYRAIGVPVAYILDRDGRILAGKSGPHHWDGAATIALIRHLLAAGAS